MSKDPVHLTNWDLYKSKGLSSSQMTRLEFTSCNTTGHGPPSNSSWQLVLQFWTRNRLVDWKAKKNVGRLSIII